MHYSQPLRINYNNLYPEISLFTSFFLCFSPTFRNTTRIIKTLTLMYMKWRIQISRYRKFYTSAVHHRSNQTRSWNWIRTRSEVVRIRLSRFSFSSFLFYSVTSSYRRLTKSLTNVIRSFLLFTANSSIVSGSISLRIIVYIIQTYQSLNYISFLLKKVLF